MADSNPNSEADAGGDGVTDTVETWAEYWERQFESRERQAIAAAARDPLSGWLFLDVGAVVGTEIDVDRQRVQSHPDAVLSAARDGFREFVANEPDLATPDGETYDRVPIHFIGLSRVERDDWLALADPVAETDTLTTLPNARKTTDPTVTHRATRITYRCPADHETTVDQPIHRTRTLDTCGRSYCSNEVFVEDSRTRAVPLVSFDVEYDGHSLRCVGTGRYAHEPERTDAAEFHLTGIPRTKTEADGTVTVVYELSNVERVPP